jgi:high affinity Mn2+ porin
LTAGLAIADVQYSSDMDYRNVPGYGMHLPAESSKYVTGSAIGAGVEHAMGQHLSARLEYLYYDLRKRTQVGSSTPITLPNDFQYTWSASAQIFRLGLNYRF